MFNYYIFIDKNLPNDAHKILSELLNYATMHVLEWLRHYC